MADIVSLESFEDRFETDSVREEYDEFREGEGIPVHTGLAVEDINDLDTGEWERTGQLGALVNLYGMEGIVDLQLHELLPDGETSRQHHLYEEIVYVTAGRGATAIGDEGDQTVFEWEEGALFEIPQNTPYHHVNLSDEPARLVSQTALPLLLELITDPDVIFDPERNYWSEHREDFYSAEGSIHEGKTFPVVWKSNFVPDISRFDKLEAWHLRGAGGSSVRFPLADSAQWAHISEFPVGTYKKAHRHGPGANVGVLSGEGYSLMWREGWDEKVKIPWKERSFLTPPARWYHQHFNLGGNPARYFAIHGPTPGTMKQNGMFMPHIPENQIEYVEEDPAIGRVYDAELDRVGRESKMPDACYTDPDYVFE